jgi:hypothetical protein
VTTAGAKLNSNAICGVEVPLEFPGANSLRGMGMEKPGDANQNQNTKGRSACVLDQDDSAGEEFQSPSSIAHLYVGKEEEVQSESDSDQTKR